MSKCETTFSLKAMNFHGLISVQNVQRADDDFLVEFQ